jgi:hypothetical protein
MWAARPPLPLFHQQHRPAAFDFARDFSMHVRGHAGDAARQDFAAFGHEFFQQVRVLVIDRLRRDIDAPPRHRPIGATKSGASFGSLGLHQCERVSR